MGPIVAHKIAWTALVLIGVAANARMLSEAVRRLRRVRRSGRNGPLRLIATQAVRGEAVTLLVQCLLATLTAAAWHFRVPVSPHPDAGRFYALCGWVLVACSLTLTADSVLDLQDRRRLFRWAERAGPAAPHRPTEPADPSRPQGAE